MRHVAMRITEYRLVRVIEVGEMADQFGMGGGVVSAKRSADDSGADFGARRMDTGNDYRHDGPVSRASEDLARCFQTGRHRKISIGGKMGR
jgi:hypothetical protein